eukprot:355472-Chlamydomonas_euryale.AAC.5
MTSLVGRPLTTIRHYRHALRSKKRRRGGCHVNQVSCNHNDCDVHDKSRSRCPSWALSPVRVCRPYPHLQHFNFNTTAAAVQRSAPQRGLSDSLPCHRNTTPSVTTALVRSLHKEASPTPSHAIARLHLGNHDSNRGPRPATAAVPHACVGHRRRAVFEHAEADVRRIRREP